MIIRDATPEDADEACAVLRASITELCEADHRNAPEILSRWLANKTPDHVAAWADSGDSSLMVVVEGESIVAIGGVTDDGEITANYVAPKARYRGASSVLLAALEGRATQRGAKRITLLSTKTAHDFYLARGYRDDGPTVGKFGTAASYPMMKTVGVSS
jgi:GNAT superfamily N-acetyltransferase